MAFELAPRRGDHSRDDARPSAGVGACPASFGELLQGLHPSGARFLVNLKTSLMARAEIRLWPRTVGRDASPAVPGVPTRGALAPAVDRQKSRRAVQMVLQHLRRDDDFTLNIASDVPIGKGLSSSTSDMVASLRALARALGTELPPSYVSKILSSIEPNDGLHHAGTSVYRHVDGELIRSFDYVPPYHIVGIDTGGQVDTIQFNRAYRVPSASVTAHYERLLVTLMDALAARKTQVIADVATQSAILWQRHHPKPSFHEVMAWAAATRAAGVVNAHSGTYLGLLYDEGRDDLPRIMRDTRAQFPLYGVRYFRTLGCRGPDIME